MATGDLSPCPRWPSRSSSPRRSSGAYIHRVMEGERTFLSPVLRPVERVDLPRRRRRRDRRSRAGSGYTISVLVFGARSRSSAGYVVLRLQDVLPLNQGGIPAMSPELAFNTSVSFETNTNWQNYSGETGATYLTQAGMLAVRNFTSAATGLADRDRAVPRADAPERDDDRQLLGRPDARDPLPPAADLDRRRPRPRLAGRAPDLGPHARRDDAPGRAQTIAIGPIASQEWIKELGNNGGGFLNANSAHPFENPTALTNWLEMFAILLFPFALTYAFGRYAGDQRQGWTIFAAMAIVLSIGAVVARCTSSASATRCSRPASTRPARQHGGQGGPVRCRRSAACSWPSRPAPARARSTPGTTAPSPSPASSRCSTCSWARSRPGGIGAGHVRDADHRRDPRGVHRGPDGRPDARVPRQEGRGVRDQDGDAGRPRARRQHPRLHGPRLSVTPEGLAGPLNAGPHGFSEILYAFSSQTGNNGSAFAGLTGNTPFYNVTGALAMLIGRYGMIVPILALAGSMAAKRRVAPSLGHVPDHRVPCGPCC